MSQKVDPQNNVFFLWALSFSCNNEQVILSVGIIDSKEEFERLHTTVPSTVTPTKEC